MYLSKLDEFCDNTALDTGGAGTYLIGSQMDLVNPRDIGNQTRMYLVAIVSETATSGGSATLQLKLASDETAAIAVDGSASEHIASGTFAVADLSAGTVLMQVPLPLEGSTAYEQFLGILQVTGGAAFTGGRVDVFLTPDPQANRQYPDEGSR